MNKNIFSVLAVSLLVLPIVVMAQEDLPTPKVVPGHWAYGLKTAWENVQMVFTRNSQSRARLNIRLARERLAEAKVVAEGKPEEAEKLMERYQMRLMKAEEEVNKSKGIGQDVSELLSQMEESNQKHRAVLELVQNKVPEQAKESIQRSIQRSEEFGKTMERVRSETQEASREREESGQQEGKIKSERAENETRERNISAVTGKGTLIMKITDKPVSGEITDLYVTISKVEVHKASYGEGNGENDNNAGWITITEEEKVYNLPEIEDVQEFLASEELDVGKYTQVRLYISDATVTVDGEESGLRILSNSVKLVNAFNIEEGKVTELLLDFEAGDSVIETGRGRYQLKPVIKITEISSEATTTTVETTTPEETTTTTVEETTPEMTTSTTVEETTPEETTTTTMETTTTIEETTSTTTAEITTTTPEPTTTTVETTPEETTTTTLETTTTTSE
ncbi:MAG: DUF4382 domain-containing protein [Candidatus Aenigmarchaeota archaeon]|nr:DUF4382 domain-containing protein [Candidatus Aenigmarchaeota archaeon]